MASIQNLVAERRRTIAARTPLFKNTVNDNNNIVMHKHIKPVHNITNYRNLEFVLKHPELGGAAMQMLQFKLPVTKNDQKTSLDVYMKHIFQKARQGKTYTEKNIADITNVYKGFLTSVGYTYKLNLVDFIFKSKLGKRDQDLEFTPVIAFLHKITNVDNFKKISNLSRAIIPFWKVLGFETNYNKITKYVQENIHNPDRQTLFYMPLALAFQNGQQGGHQNMMLIDTSKEPFKIYTIDPLGNEYPFLKSSMNSFLQERGLYPSIQCAGGIHTYIPCQNTMSVQKKMNTQTILCTVLATFQVYLLSRYEPNKLHNLIQNTSNTSMLSYIFGGRKQDKVIDSSSMLYQYEHMNQGQQRYIVGKFIERIFNVAVGKIDTVTRGRFTKDIENLVISNIQNDTTKELFRTAFVKKEHISHIVERGNLVNVHPIKFINKAHLFSR